MVRVTNHILSFKRFVIHEPWQRNVFQLLSLFLVQYSILIKKEKIKNNEKEY